MDMHNFCCAGNVPSQAPLPTTSLRYDLLDSSSLILRNGICGLLHKWVNYGKGWRPQWFVLRDGVLSYYKLHGPNKILFSHDDFVEKGFKVIGDDSIKRISRHKARNNRANGHNHQNHSSSSRRSNPCGEIHLKTEKVDLENTVVDESQRQLKDQETSEVQDELSEGTVSGSEDDNEKADVVEEDTDVEYSNFFDTRDFLSSRSNGSGFQRPPSSSDEENQIVAGSVDFMNPSINSGGAKYPYVKRRKKLPDPVEKEKGVSLWSIIKDNIGKDLTKVCLPVYFNEPLSSLQKCFEDLEYSYLIDRASEWGKQGNSLMRILNIAAFSVSGYASTEGRIRKPFNPLLGETYEADYPDKGIRFFSEKVSHHPMVVACHYEGTEWKFWGDSNLRSKFWGRSIQLDPTGVLTVEFDDGEVFQWSKVTTSIYNLILGKLYCDHYGTMRIQGNSEYSCKLKFKEQSIIDRNPHQVHGIVQDKSRRTVATLFGKWDDSMHYINGDFSGSGKGFETLSEAHLLWKRNKPSRYPTRYNFTRFAITLNELTPGLKEKLPPTDSRLRPDQMYLENGEYEMANLEKLRLEQRQQQSQKMQESGWKPQWFHKDKASGTYRYIGGYWEAREQANWSNCPNIFGQVASDSTKDENH